MAMRLDLNGLVQYIRQWLKDTAKIEIDEPLAQQFLNMAYLESADRAMWKVEILSSSSILVAGQGEYTMTELGIVDMIRPKLVLLDGVKLLDGDFESMAAAGYFNPDAETGDPTLVNFLTGNMILRPIPDAVAAAKTLMIVYASSPLVLSDPGNLTLDGKFRTAWQEVLCWLVLKRAIMLPKEEEARTLFMSPQQIENECQNRLAKIQADVWSTAVSARKIKDRSSETDAKYFADNFFTS